MIASNVWQVMTPIAGEHGDRRWWPTLVVALHEIDARRIAEQAAMTLGFSFDGDIELNHVGRCYAQF